MDKAINYQEMMECLFDDEKDANKAQIVGAGGATSGPEAGWLVGVRPQLSPGFYAGAIKL